MSACHYHRECRAILYRSTQEKMTAQAKARDLYVKDGFLPLDGLCIKRCFVKAILKKHRGGLEPESNEINNLLNRRNVLSLNILNNTAPFSTATFRERAVPDSGHPGARAIAVATGPSTCETAHCASAL